MLTRCIIFVFAMAVAPILHGQWSFSKVVRDKALLPRNVTSNLGEAAIAGTVNSSAYSKLQYQVLQNGKVYASYFQTLNFSGGTAGFDLRIKLRAGKFRYRIQLELIGVDTISRVFDDIVVGDVYIIQGQSNAAANSFNGLSQGKYGDSFIRSFGSSSFDPALSAADTFWYLARGDAFYNKGCVGQWGLVLAKKLLDTFGIPIAVINGAVGGTSVVYHQRYNPQPDNVNTCYGRLLTRMRLAGLEKSVRSILWYQGESDGSWPKLHDSVFRILYADWFKDYKGMVQNYMVQVRGGGCGTPTAVMLEIQRQFGYDLNKLKVVSSNGLNGHDGCHFAFVNGYEQLGIQFAALISRDIYAGKKKRHIDPPQILRAEYNSAALSEIILTMENTEDSIFVDPGFHALFSVSGDIGVFISGGKMEGNRVMLVLNKGTCKPLTLNYMGKSGIQPWVKNSLRMGLIGFYQIPVTKKEIRTTYSGCKNADIVLGNDSLPGAKYLWTNNKYSFTRTTSNIKWKLTEDATFQLVVNYAASGCFKDTFEVVVVMEKTPEPELGPDTILCNHSVLNLELPVEYAQTIWRQGVKTSKSREFSTVVSGMVYLEVVTSLGCTYRDSMRVRTSAPQVNITTTNYVCQGLDTVSIATQGFVTYNWNGFQTNRNEYRHKAGSIALLAVDTLGCETRDTSNLFEYPTVQLPNWKISLCPYDSILIQRPVVVSNWEVNGRVIDNGFFVHPGLSKINWLDQNKCAYSDTILVLEKELPAFSLGRDTSICPGSEVVFHCTYLTSVYNWNGELYPVATFKTKDSGKVICMVRGVSGCEFSDEATVAFHPTPNFQLPKDTEICENTFWYPNLPTTFTYAVNGVPTSKVGLKLAGNYTISAFNEHGCVKDAVVYLKVISCTNGTTLTSQNEMVIYPNPVFEELTINIPTDGEFSIYDNQGRQVAEGFKSFDGAINVASLQPGTYTLHLRGAVTRFVKL